jgi:hypothetical protein
MPGLAGRAGTDHRRAADPPLVLARTVLRPDRGQTSEGDAGDGLD